MNTESVTYIGPHSVSGTDSHITAARAIASIAQQLAHDKGLKNPLQTTIDGETLQVWFSSAELAEDKG